MRAMRDAMPYQELLGRNLRMARAAARISQTEIAARMRALGFAWHRQTVQKVEYAARPLTVPELVGLMVVFETDLTALAYPSGEWPVSLPSGAEVMLPVARFGPDVHPARSVWPAR